MKTVPSKLMHTGPLKVKLQKSQARFVRQRDSKGNDFGRGEFFLELDIIAGSQNIYLPLSIASGKKPAGFVYQIEGTGEGNIVTTDIKARGEGITQVMSGTLLYIKIPGGKKATFRILVEMKGKLNKSYKIIIDRINYKFDPNDARYQRFQEEVNSKLIQFR